MNHTAPVSVKPPKVRIEQVARLVVEMIGGVARPSDDDDSPPGPWDPVLRFAGAIRAIAASSFHDRYDSVALNPQPLPPRVAHVLALGDAALLRVELAESAGEGAGARLMIDLVDDWCGTPPRPIPFPGPRPDWARARLGALDHLLLAASLEGLIAARPAEALTDALKAGRRRLHEAAATALAR